MDSPPSERDVRETDEALSAYRFNDAASALYRFTWSEFCDWYVSCQRRTSTVATPERKRTASMCSGIRSGAPPAPAPPVHAVYHRRDLAGAPESATPAPGDRLNIMRSAYPNPCPEWRGVWRGGRRNGTGHGGHQGIRNIRGEMEVPPSREIAVLLIAPQRPPETHEAQRRLNYQPCPRSSLAIGRGWKTCGCCPSGGGRRGNSCPSQRSGRRGRGGKAPPQGDRQDR